MNKFALKSAVLAIGALAGASAIAATVNLGSTTAPTTTKYANELVVSSTTGLDLAGVEAANMLTFKTTLGVTLGAAQQGYFRIDLSNGAKFKGVPASVAVATGGAGTLSSGGDGFSYAVYTIAADAGNTAAKDITLTLNATGLTVFNKNPVAMRMRLYETLTTAQNPDAASSLALSDTTSKNILEFSNAVSHVITPASVVANVSPATGAAYTSFVDQNAGGISLGLIDYTLAAREKADSNVDVAASDILADTNDVVVTGTNGADFSYVSNADGTYTGAALARVFLSTSSTCASSAVAATTLTASTATFTDVTAAQIAQDLYVCVKPRGAGTISAGNYTIAIDNDGKTGYTPADVATATLATVTRNGTTLVAPLVNQPAGWYSRLVLTNSGSTDRTYTVTAVKEDGSTVTLTGEAAEGTVLANRTKVIDLHNLATIVAAAGGGVRTGLQVVVNGPGSQISGQYQIVSPAGNIANNTLVVK